MEKQESSDRVLIINTGCPQSSNEGLKKINKKLNFLVSLTSEGLTILKEIDKETTEIAEVLLEEIEKLKTGAITVEQLESIVKPRIDRLKAIGTTETH